MTSSVILDFPRKSLHHQPKFEIRIQGHHITIKGWSVGSVHKNYIALLLELDALALSHGYLHITFDYKIFDTVSAGFIIKILKLMNQHYQVGRTMRVTWRAEANDSEMIDSGIDFSHFFDLPFEFQLK